MRTINDEFADFDFIKNLENFDLCKRVTIYHHIRNATFGAFLKSKGKEIKKIKNNEDEYSFRCQNLIVCCMELLCDYLWSPASSLCFNTEIIPDQRNNHNFFLSKNPGEGTIWFTSLTIKEQLDAVAKGNQWAKNNGLKIMFWAINGDTTRTSFAEKMAEGRIACNPEYHHVFITANMAARSFSVAKIVNGVMLVNAPGVAPAEQKFKRLASVDYDNPSKEGHMYWFNFSDIKVTCPIYELIYQDILEKKEKVDQDGNKVKNILDDCGRVDCYNIFCVQNKDMKKEVPANWTEADLFQEINKNGFSHSALESFAYNDKNLINEIKNMISALPQNFLIDAKTMIASTGQENINGGASRKGKKRNKQNNDTEQDKKAEQKIIPVQLACKFCEFVLTREKEDRTFENFYIDSWHLFKKDAFNIVQKKQLLEKLWNNCFKNL